MYPPTIRDTYFALDRIARDLRTATVEELDSPHSDIQYTLKMRAACLNFLEAYDTQYKTLHRIADECGMDSDGDPR